MNLFKRAIIKVVTSILKFINIHLGLSFAHKQEQYRLLLLNKLDIDLVVDAGANVGQYAMELINVGYKKQIISFEPIEEAYSKLIKNQENHNNWLAFRKCALGSENSEIKINISQNLESSSIYPVLKKSIIAEPKTEYIRQEKVNVYRLDDVLDTDPNNNIHLKIDVQGYEHQVLIGSEKLFDKVNSIELEISLIPLYENALNPETLLKVLESYGYLPVFYIPVFTDPNTGGILQLNGFFVKKELMSRIE